MSMIKLSVIRPTREESLLAGQALLKQTAQDYNLIGKTQLIQHANGPLKLQFIGPVSLEVKCEIGARPQPIREAQ